MRLVRWEFLTGLLFILVYGFPVKALAADSIVNHHVHNSVIRVGGDHNYPPYEFLDETGLATGYNVELTQAIAEVMGIRVDIQLGLWSDMRKAVLTGELDVLQGMSVSEPRKQFFDFSASHALVHQSLFAHPLSPNIESLDELAGKEVIVQRGGIMHDKLKALDLKVTLIPVDTHADALRLLATLKHDYAAVANLPGLYLSRELKLTNIRTVMQPFLAQRYGYAVRKGEEDLLAQFVQGLAILKNTGRQQQIYQKWFSTLEAGFPWKALGLSGAAVSILMLFIIASVAIWNRSLRKKVEERTQDLQERQKQLMQVDKMASLGILVSGVAHEINNPCGILTLNFPVVLEAFDEIRELLDEEHEERGGFELMGMPYLKMRDTLHDMLQDMDDSTKRIKGIVADLKHFSSQSGDDKHSMESLDLNELCETACRLTANTINKTSVQFVSDFEQALPKFMGHAQRIEQVIVNLILNSCQASQGTESTIRISTHYDKYSRRVSLQITDQGCGISEENMAKLTDPFFTTNRQEGGTGLGLSVSAGIVRDHDGILHFTSKIGVGTTVMLSVPAIEKGSNND